MRILIVGSGGREHALAWKIAQSQLVTKIYCAPGNPGMAKHAECVDIAAKDIDGLLKFAIEHKIDLTVVGPEDPLAAGIVDLFQKAGMAIWGPTAAATQLESSKSWARHFMTRHNIPTPRYAVFDNAEEAIAYVHQQGEPIVIKADGLAAGKGVVVASTLKQAVRAIEEAFGGAFGQAGKIVVVEECMIGEEASIFALSDGWNILPLATSQDHKRLKDGDEGPNTGGMGAYSPAPVVTPELFDEISQTILEPCIRGMAKEGTPYVGVLYAGVMITAQGPKVVEFNCRFGDPETQVILPRMKSDIVPLLEACCDGILDEYTISWYDNACVCVVMVADGYPGSYKKGLPISGIENAEANDGVIVFHAGTKLEDGKLVTNGGRVLGITDTGSDIRRAIENAYEATWQVGFEGAQCRTDIGEKALLHLQ